MTKSHQQLEERIIEIRHRLVVDAECAELDRSPEFLDVEEELLDELRELELVLAAEEIVSHDHCAAHQTKSREIGL